MAIQHPNDIQTSISRLQQTAFATARTNADDFRRLIPTSHDLGSRTTEFADNAGHETGQDMATDKWALTHDTAIPFPVEFCFEDIGFLLLDVLGSVATSNLGGSLYQHTFTHQNVSSSRAFGSRTMLKKYGGLKIVLFRSMFCEQLVISCPTVGRIQTNANYRGDGCYAEDPAGYTSPALTEDREWAYATQSFLRFNTGTGTAQVETATAAGSATTPGNVNVTVTSANLLGSPILVPVAVLGTETAAQWADKVRIALRANSVIASTFVVSGSSTSIVLTDRKKRANDATFNIAIANNGTGVTDAASSANTTAGAAGTYHEPACKLDTWELTISQPLGDPGYRQCSSPLVSGNPASGVTRAEAYIGQRQMSLTFTARLDNGDPMRQYMREQTNLAVELGIIGVESNDRSLYINHDRARVIQIDDQPDVSGFIGYAGTLDLMAAASGANIPFSAILTNAIASYTV